MMRAQQLKSRLFTVGRSLLREYEVTLLSRHIHTDISPVQVQNYNVLKHFQSNVPKKDT